jgi:hypothetical protein
MTTTQTQAGAVWYSGKGQIQAMKERRLTAGHRCAVARQKADAEYYSCASYPDWPSCFAYVDTIPPERRHVSEVVFDGEPFKPYGDLDFPKALPHGYTEERVVREVTDALVEIFKREYGVRIAAADVVWSQSHRADKWSWHYTIVAKPQPVFSFAREAKHMGTCLQAAFPQFPATAVDLSVYSSNQNLMRMIGCSKYGKGESHFRALVGSNRPVKDYVITWLDAGEVTVPIKVPVQIPAALKARKKGERPPRRLDDILSAPVLPSASKLQGEIFTLVRALHPTAYQWHGAEEAEVTDPLRGVKFNYTDRAEPCYTGEAHDGKQNFRAWVDGNGDVWCKCFSQKCSGAGDYHLGNVIQRNATRDYEAAAVHVNRQYLAPRPDQHYPHDAMDTIVQQFLRQEFQALNVKSIMATGKTTWLAELISQHLGGKSILFVTYRQSLAIELASRFAESSDFVNYMETDDWLDDRKCYPRVICQVDSLHRLCQYGAVPDFDVVILDEVTSLLNHFSARTIDHPRDLIFLFGEMLKASEKVIALDALYDDQTFHFFRDLGLSQRVIVNDYRGAPRTYSFSADQDRWTDCILRDLKAGNNVAVVTMSTEAGYRLTEHITQEGILGPGDIVLHTSKSDDKMKEGLKTVATFWRKRLVIYSPTIEAGVDFNVTHFHRLYVYCCLRSTTPLGLAQMTGRIRQVEDMTVRCCVTKNMGVGNTTKVPQYVTSEDSKQAVRFLYRAEGRRRGADEAPAAEAFPSIPLTYQRTEGGGCALIPEDTPMTDILAANYARAENGQRRFLLEVKCLLQESGHQVCFRAPAAESEGEAAGGKDSKRKEMLLTVKPVSEEEHARIRWRIEKNRASESDKWTDYAMAYRRAWCIDKITEEFVEEHGTECGSEAVDLVICCMTPDWQGGEVVGNLTRDAFPVKVRIVREVVAALGLTDILDAETTFDVEGRREQLMQTALFRNWEQLYRHFQPRCAAKAGGSFSLRRITDTLRSVFKSCKLTMVSTRDRKGAVGNQERRDYCLNAEQVVSMRELAALKYWSRKGTRLTAGGKAPALEGVTIVKYAELVTQEQ